MQAVVKFHTLGHDWLFRVGNLKLVAGINSNLKDGSHILMWEFDNASYYPVREALLYAQDQYQLPDIHILQASSNKSWHAMCFARCPWPLAISIVAGTPGIDLDWLRMCVNRENWTLRVTDKGQGEPKVFEVLAGALPEATPEDLTHAVLYHAWRRGDEKLDA